jgi:hypothetical protein
MKLQQSLSAKILITAFVNVALLIIVFLVSARVQSRFNLSSFLLAPARDRIFSASRLIALNLEETARPSWDRVLEQYATKYETQFFLFDGRGKQYGGAPMTLPAAVTTALSDDFFLGNAPNPPDPRRASQPWVKALYF